jgi:hypothetical protein
MGAAAGCDVRHTKFAYDFQTTYNDAMSAAKAEFMAVCEGGLRLISLCRSRLCRRNARSKRSRPRSWACAKRSADPQHLPNLLHLVKEVSATRSSDQITNDLGTAIARAPANFGKPEAGVKGVGYGIGRLEIDFAGDCRVV